MSSLLQPNDTRLNLTSRAIALDEISTKATKELIADMLDLAQGERDATRPNRPSMVGLAAPQIGEALQVIIIDLAAEPSVPNFVPDLKVFINPHIIETSGREALGREGCYSTGNICGAVFRSDEVTVVAFNEHGKEFQFKSQNPFQARILQHEIDHLHGIRFPSRIRNPAHLHKVDKDDFQRYRENWETWKSFCPVSEWLTMYEGKHVTAKGGV